MDPDSLLDHVFLDQPIHNEVLSKLVRSKLGDILTLVPSPTKHDINSSCLLADIGDYLLRSLKILARLADDLTNGPHIESHAREIIELMSNENDFSELDILEYMSSKHGSIQCV